MPRTAFPSTLGAELDWPLNVGVLGSASLLRQTTLSLLMHDLRPQSLIYQAGGDPAPTAPVLTVTYNPAPPRPLRH